MESDFILLIIPHRGYFDLSEKERPRYRHVRSFEAMLASQHAQYHRTGTMKWSVSVTSLVSQFKYKHTSYDVFVPQIAVKRVNMSHRFKHVMHFVFPGVLSVQAS